MSAQSSALPSSLRLLTLILLSGSAMMLTACGTTGNTTAGSAAVNSALSQTADQAGGGSASLGVLEKLYKRNPDDVGTAVKYSRALRDAGRLSRASIVIAPFAKNDRKPSTAARTEFAAVQVALGNYDVAADYARKATVMDAQSWQAYDILGIALDAKGDHANAEKALRKSLELAQPDEQTAILNNLGLNLAAQGFLDEAAEVLRRALASAPDRTEVERNLRIVSALRESGGRAPSYALKARDEALKKEAAAKEKAAAKKEAAKPADKSAVKEAPVVAEKPKVKEAEKTDAPVPAKKPQFN